MPAPANDYIANATLIDLDSLPFFDSTSTADADPADPFSGYPDVWYRIEPSVDTTVLVTVEDLSGNAAYSVEADFYRFNGGADPPTSFSQLDWEDKYVFPPDEGAGPASGALALSGGEIYFVELYLFRDAGGSPDPAGALSIRIEENTSPANDNVVNAQVVPAGSQDLEIIATTVGATTESQDEIDDFSFGAPTVWYEIPIGGPGVFMFNIEVVDPDQTFGPIAHLFYTAGGADATSFADLVSDNIEVWDEQIPDQPPTGPFFYSGFTADLDPIEGGERFYIMVTSVEGNGPGDGGAFKLTVTTPPESTCLNAADYINGSSPTATVVGGAVRESQSIRQSWANTTKAPYDGQADIPPGAATLIIPGSAITDSPGFFAAHIWTKNSTVSQQIVTIRRNGQPLYPGAQINDVPGSTPGLSHLTMLAFAPDPNYLDMCKFIPVHPDDELELVLEHNFVTADTVDITQVCFQRVADAVVGPAYDTIEIPDYPLGTVEADLLTADQQGDLLLDKAVAPTFYTHEIKGQDMCITDDGKVWVVYCGELNTTSGLRYMGPVLMMWDPASPGWQEIDRDVEGLGYKRTPTASNQWPVDVSIDTDGTDLWMAYGIDIGAWAANPAARELAIRVKKYTVGTDTMSTVGGVIHSFDLINQFAGNSTSTLFTTMQRQAGGFDWPPVIRVSPAGVPWVAFVDHYGPLASGEPMIAQWTGSTWNVVLAGFPTANTIGSETYAEPDHSRVFQAEDYENGGSGTVSEVTHLSETAIRDTQTTFAADTIRIIPPAGNWGVPRCRLGYTRPSGTGGASVRAYKNGVPFNAKAEHQQVSSSVSPTVWQWTNPASARFYETFNGTTDELELRLRCTGTATEAFIDRFIMYTDKELIENQWFGAPFPSFGSEGQPIVALWMHQLGEDGLGENPAVLWGTSTVQRYHTEDIDLGEGPFGFLPPGVDNDSSNDVYGENSYIYSEWNGSEFVTVWDKLIEEGAPRHLYAITREDDIASTAPFGHFHQGFSFCTDGIENYWAGYLAGGQAFGFFGDTTVCLKIGPEGFEPFTEGPPGMLQGPGYPQGVIFGLAGFSGWTGVSGARSIHMDEEGSMWYSWGGIGPTANAEDFVAVSDKNGPYLNGVGDWYAAAETNNYLGHNNFDSARPCLAVSPDGTTLYIFSSTFIFSDAINPVESVTTGVWECPITRDSKVPLIPVASGEVNMNIRTSRRMDVVRLNQ